MREWRTQQHLSGSAWSLSVVWQTRLVVQEHEVKGVHAHNDLDILDTNALLGAIGQFLEGTVRACLLVDSDDFRVHDKRADLLRAEEINEALGRPRCCGGEVRRRGGKLSREQLEHHLTDIGVLLRHILQVSA